MYAHLAKSVEEYLLQKGNEDVQKRIRLIDHETWIGYEKAKSIIDKAKDMIDRPRVTRMHCMLVIGSSDNGKTTIRKRIESLNESRACESGKSQIKVVSLQMPPNPDERGFYNSIFSAMLHPIHVSSKRDFVLRSLIMHMRDYGVRLLMIDEVQHIERLANRRQRIILDAIKHLSSELSLPILAFGPNEALNIFASDIQLHNRFKKVVLPKWEPDDNYLRLLTSFEQLIPLKEPSGLSQKDMASKIYHRTNGTIGEINTLIRDAAKLALKSGLERITPAIIDQVEFESAGDVFI